jgi:hypothetical protein
VTISTEFFTGREADGSGRPAASGLLPVAEIVVHDAEIQLQKLLQAGFWVRQREMPASEPGERYFSTLRSLMPRGDLANAIGAYPARTSTMPESETSRRTAPENRTHNLPILITAERRNGQSALSRRAALPANVVARIRR